MVTPGLWGSRTMGFSTQEMIRSGFATAYLFLAALDFYLGGFPSPYKQQPILLSF